MFQISHLLLGIGLHFTVSKMKGTLCYQRRFILGYIDNLISCP